MPDHEPVTSEQYRIEFKARRTYATFENFSGIFGTCHDTSLKEWSVLCRPHIVHSSLALGSRDRRGVKPVMPLDYKQLRVFNPSSRERDGASSKAWPILPHSQPSGSVLDLRFARPQWAQYPHLWRNLGLFTTCLAGRLKTPLCHPGRAVSPLLQSCRSQCLQLARPQKISKSSHQSFTPLSQCYHFGGSRLFLQHSVAIPFYPATSMTSPMSDAASAILLYFPFSPPPTITGYP